MAAHKWTAVLAKGLIYGIVLPLSTYIAFFVARRLYRSSRIRKLGARARSVGNTPFQAPRLISRGLKAAREDTFIEYWQALYKCAAPEAPNVLEMEVDFLTDKRLIVTRDPEHMKTVLTTKFNDFGKGEDFHQQWSPFLGDSIFVTDGSSWHASRQLIKPMFLKDRVSDLHIFEDKTQCLFDVLPPSGQTVDLSEKLYSWTLDVSTEFLLGAGVGSLQNPKNEFQQAFNEVQKIQAKIFMMSPFDVFYNKTDYYRHIRDMESFILPFIERTLAMPPAEIEKLTKFDTQFTFLHHLASFTQDPKVIRDQLVAVLLAARDTTAGTLSWAFYELAAAPDKWAKLRAEVLSALGGGPSSRAPTYADLKAMRYLRYTLNETLRLYPAVPYNVRAALRDTSLPGAPGQPDIAVLAGDQVLYHPLNMQRRADLYPPTSDKFADPAVFSPERWYEWTPKSWEYIPFNGGPRICVGQNFALTQMSYFVARMAQKYERIEYRGDWHAQVHQADIVGRPKFGVPIALYGAAAAAAAAA